MNPKDRTGRYDLHGHYDLGTVAQLTGRRRKAIREYKKEIELTNYFKAHYNLGTIYDSQRRYQKALNEYTAALRLQRLPGDPEILAGLAVKALRGRRSTI